MQDLINLGFIQDRSYNDTIQFYRKGNIAPCYGIAIFENGNFTVYKNSLTIKTFSSNEIKLLIEYLKTVVI